MPQRQLRVVFDQEFSEASLQEASRRRVCKHLSRGGAFRLRLPSPKFQMPFRLRGSHRSGSMEATGRASWHISRYPCSIILLLPAFSYRISSVVCERKWNRSKGTPLVDKGRGSRHCEGPVALWFTSFERR